MLLLACRMTSLKKELLFLKKKRKEKDTNNNHIICLDEELKRDNYPPEI
jgi:hypothetical protein